MTGTSAMSASRVTNVRKDASSRKNSESSIVAIGRGAERLLNMAKRRWIAWALLGAIAAVQTGCTYVNAEQQAKPELLKPVKRQEDLFEVKSGSIVSQIRGVGFFVPASTKYYQHATGGKIAALRVKAGDSVAKGDVLLELDPQDLPMKIVEQKLVVAKAEERLEEAKTSRDAEVLRLAGLNLDVERMKLQGLEAKLAKTKLTADKAGTVTFLDFVKPGDTLASYKDVVGVSDPKELLFLYAVPAAGGDLSSVELGAEAEIAYKGSTYKGKVIQTPRTSPFTDNPVQVEKNTRSILVALDRLPDDAEIGGQGDLSIVTERRDNVLVIPRVGLRSYQGRSFVHVKDGDSRKEVDVEKGLETATEVEIRKGLKAGQQLILNN
ncbi:efflux RND transporter periplasmic adaptor subunit [Paenibacillus flagellatus]|uniref:Efflux transporter periplasmic adaptor subunit n=1 Tax=Paenibacillus flagellatus TaxID=2211139 RepID=A0A2V5JVT3_9BACL|nr:biotin/lipoyl-binding protein [Paenibacillus flagellatus]PYI50829.1 efflux transporter periplasmic adaptor subunit [Paenibacillus flagellatus]